MRKLAVSSACVVVLSFGLAACGPEAGEDVSDRAGSDAGASADVDEPVTGDGATPDEPLPADEPFTVGDWEISILAVNLDATDEYLDASPNNAPPYDDDQFVLAEVEYTYNGDGGGEPGVVVAKVAAPERKEFGGISMTCGEHPDDLADHGRIEYGETVAGVVCVVVPGTELDGAVWHFDVFATSDVNPVFVHLDQG